MDAVHKIVEGIGWWFIVAMLGGALWSWIAVTRERRASLAASQDWWEGDTDEEY